jgi:mannose-6-phosphate isomerase-like protein (cupin superfamily)
MPEVGESFETSLSTRWCAELSKHWPDVPLPAVFCEERTSTTGRLFGRYAISEKDLNEQEWIALDQPVLLKTHREPKPWGSEIWYSGIEKRGVCSVETHRGQVVSLPIFLALSAGKNQQIKTPSLLKILDPAPERSRGNLYVEVHQQKWETYIVTSVSNHLYPDGAGELLFGFSQQRLAELGGDESVFRRALGKVAARYEVVRRCLDNERPLEDVCLAGLSPQDDLVHQAELLWKEVTSFFNLKKVRVGDVIRVPPFTPHSLQPGVRVVEFQTPTYERLILAFNQKVLTQNHWDTAKAIEVASFGQQDDEAVEASESGWQPIVQFPEFEVHRCTVQPQAVVELPTSKPHEHSMLFVISGEIEINFRLGGETVSLSAETAALLPVATGLLGPFIRCKSSKPAILLFV